MAKIKKFEEIESWKKARKLASEIYQLTSTGKFARYFGLKDQIRRASVSILSNIAEGFERGGDQEFLQFLAVAKGSCGEHSATLRRAGSELLFRGALQDTVANRARGWPVDFRVNEVSETI